MHPIPIGDHCAGCPDNFKGKELIGDHPDSASSMLMSVEQISWDVGMPWSNVSATEINQVMYSIMDDCDAGTTTGKWGGWSNVGDDTIGYRRYNLTRAIAAAIAPPGFSIVT